MLQFHKLSRQDGENAEEWMGRLRLSAIECNYKETDKLKEQFIHGLNDTEVLGEIIQELTKIKENEKKTMSKNMLSWAKRNEVQRVQSTIMNILTKAKEFDRIKVTKMYTRTVLEDKCRQRCLQSRHANIVVAAIP